jgi:predicted signal transduction protein with EAL and GGDEF domain
MTSRKGNLEEILSKAIYADNPHLYSISYRNFDSVVQVPLLEFLKLSENFDVIPASRIIVVSKGVHELYRKFPGTKDNQPLGTK